MMTDFYGGMFIYFLSFPYLITTIFITYVVSFLETLASLLKNGFRTNKIKRVFHVSLLSFIVLLTVFQSELFKSKKILTAVLEDDLYRYTLILRKNGNCEIENVGIFSYNKTTYGHYSFKGDTILFQKKPYDNDFIPDTLLIDRKQKVIFITKDDSGTFVKSKSFLNHFSIISN
ncbi:MAG: hypothetical protein EOO96_05345 [Pedobacter sp.]|nr:MAG: hypothetical protein EOO96_05345 [Pedobacter sp.]